MKAELTAEAQRTQRAIFSLAVERTAREKFHRLFNSKRNGVQYGHQSIEQQNNWGSHREVHRALGPGLLESAYEKCLCYELNQQELAFDRQRSLPVIYKGQKIDCGYKLDVVVENTIILELKSCEKIEPIHKAQLLTYLRLSGFKLGLLLNFNVPFLREGIVRIVNGLAE
jgi:GxxExxY protein